MCLGSSTALWVIRRSTSPGGAEAATRRSGRIVRNLSRVKGSPCLPTLRCRNSTPGPSERRTAEPINTRTGDIPTSSTAAEPTSTTGFTRRIHTPWVIDASPPVRCAPTGMRSGSTARVTSPRPGTSADVTHDVTHRDRTDTEEDRMDTGDILTALRRRWLIALTGLIVGGLASGVVVLASPTVYTSSGSFYLVPVARTNDVSSVFNSNSFVEQRARSYAAIGSSLALATRMRQQLGEPAEAAVPSFTASYTPDTALIPFSATGRSAVAAQRAAQLLARTLPAEARQLDSTVGSPVPIQLKVASQPLLPRAASSPRPALDLAFGLGVGALLGVSLAILAERLARSRQRAPARDPVIPRREAVPHRAVPAEEA